MSNTNVVTVYSQNNIAIAATGIQGAAGPGVNAGGTTGQVLSKIDAADYHTQWISLGTLAMQNGTFSGSHSGNSSGTNTGDQTTITGNAGTATTLQTARTINGVSFNGSANITVPAAAGTLTGTALAATVVSSSLTSVGTLASLTVTAPIAGSITGNAGTATTLQTARTINGVSFNGSANITVPAAAGTLTGTALAATVVSSSLTSVGTLASLTVTAPIAGSITGNAATVTTNANLTGDVTSVGNASTIAANAVTNAKAAPMAAGTIKGNNGTATASPKDLTIAQVQGMLAIKPALQMVATRCGLNHAGGGQYNTAQPGCVTRMQHYLPYGAKSLYPVYSALTITTTNPDTETASPGGYGFYAIAATVVAGGASYAVGDRITVSGVATNQFAPTLQVDAVSAGAVTALSVVDGGGFAAAPATGLATTKLTGSGNNALTVTLTLADCAFVMQAAVEQAWNTQTAISATSVSGVMKLTAGANATLGVGNIVLPYSDTVKCDALQVGLPTGSAIGTRLYTPSTGFYAGRYLSGTAGLSE